MEKRNKVLVVVLLVAIAVGFGLFKKNKIETLPETAEEHPVAEVQSTQVAPTIPTKEDSHPQAVERLKNSQTLNSVSEKDQPLFSKEEINKLRQETKSSLASSYTAMAAYRAEWDRYTTDFQSAGWMPSGNAELKVKIGFIEPFLPNRVNKELAPGELPERNSTDIFINKPVYGDDPQGPKFYYSETLKDVNLADFRKFCRMNCTATENEFEILAVVPLGGNRFDVWTINSQKVLEQIQDGLEAP